MPERAPMTKQGQAALEAELHRLITVERRQVVRDIEEARGHGDLSENAEYHAAKERQGFIEGRIQDIEDKLSRAQVIDPATLDMDRVAFGATVTVVNVDTEEEFQYQIVGEDESDVGNGKISFQSPIARALMGKQEADEVRVRTPGGIKILEIVEIRYG